MLYGGLHWLHSYGKTQACLQTYLSTDWIHWSISGYFSPDILSWRVLCISTYLCCESWNWNLKIVCNLCFRRGRKEGRITREKMGNRRSPNFSWGEIRQQDKPKDHHNRKVFEHLISLTTIKVSTSCSLGTDFTTNDSICPLLENRY